MLSPKKQKYRKAHKGRVRNITKRGSNISFGYLALKSLDSERLNARQIEAARRAAVRHMKREGKFWIRIFPDIPVTKKPTEVRMGKGKGNVELYICRVSPGKILFEIDGVLRDLGLEALRLAGKKLPIRTKIVSLNGT